LYHSNKIYGCLKILIIFLILIIILNLLNSSLSEYDCNAWSKSLQSGCNIRLKSCGSRCHPRAAGQDTRPRTWGPDTRLKSLELDRVARSQ
jgi:hypothetical protein